MIRTSGCAALGCLASLAVTSTFGTVAAASHTSAQVPPAHPLRSDSQEVTAAKAVKKVDLNNASLAELKTLPSVSDDEAKAIIADRPYISKTDLVTKGGLPEGIYLAVRRIVVNDMKKAAQEGRAQEVMESSMKRSIAWLGAAALVLAGLAGCGGGNDGGAPAAGGSPPPPPPSGQLGAALNAAAAVPANDTSTNSSSAFTVLQANGVPAVTVAGAPVVNFTVFSDGAGEAGPDDQQREPRDRQARARYERGNRPVAELRLPHRDAVRDQQCGLRPGRNPGAGVGQAGHDRPEAGESGRISSSTTPTAITRTPSAPTSPTRRTPMASCSNRDARTGSRSS